MTDRESSRDAINERDDLIRQLAQALEPFATAYAKAKTKDAAEAMRMGVGFRHFKEAAEAKARAEAALATS